MNVQGSGGGASRVQPPRLFVTAYKGLSRIAHRRKVEVFASVALLLQCYGKERCVADGGLGAIKSGSSWLSKLLGGEVRGSA
jgi:hypothetical protein